MKTEDAELVAELRKVATQATNMADALEASANGGEVVWPAEVMDGLRDLDALTSRLHRQRRWGGR